MYGQKTAALLQIYTHLQDDARKYGNYSTTEKVFKALRSRFELSVSKAKTRLTNIGIDTKLSLTGHANNVKRLVEAAYANIQVHREEMA